MRPRAKASVWDWLHHRVTLLLALLALRVPSISGDPSPTQRTSLPLFLDATPAALAGAIFDHSGYLRSRIAGLNPAALKVLHSELASEGIVINLFPDYPCRVRLNDPSLPEAKFGEPALPQGRGLLGDVSIDTGEGYRGTVDDVRGSQVLLRVKGSRLAGSIFVPDRGIFRILPRGDGFCEIAELDAFGPPSCGLENGPRLQDKRQAGLLAAVTGESASESPREVEVMFVYTGKAKDGAFGADNLEMLARAALDEANAALQNSEAGVRFRLAHLTEIAYEESGDLTLDLARLRGGDDGFMDEVHTLRDAYAADLVCLLAEHSNSYGGLSSFPNGPDAGFSVVKRFYLAGFGLVAHELGHNFGCDHDRENKTGGGRFPFSYGHRMEVEGHLYRTVMCYAPGLPIPHFSNPAVLFGGVPTGVPESESNASDNARTIREMARIVDAFRGIDLTVVEPGAGAVGQEGVPMRLTASVTSTEGLLERVEYYDGNTLIAASDAPSIGVLWDKPFPGVHLISARAVVEDGLIKESIPVPLTIRPANDEFANRLLLSGSNFLTSSILYTATAEPGEPEHLGPANRTAWWTWTAPASEVARISTTLNGVPRPLAVVYTGNSLKSLEMVAKPIEPWTDVVFDARAGTVYQIVLEGPADQQPVLFNLTLRAPPINDAFEEAQSISGTISSIQGSTLGATRQPGEPEIESPAFGHSVWFAWRPTSSGNATITIRAPAGASPPKCAVFMGSSLADLHLVADMERAKTGFPVVSAVDYRVLVDGAYADFTLDLALTGPPRNDAFEGRLSLVGSFGTLLIDNFGATRQPGEPAHGSMGSGRSIWWSWRPMDRGGLRLARAGSFSTSTSPPLSVAIYQGTALSNLTPVASFDFTNRFYQESFVLPVPVATNYAVAIDSGAAIRGNQFIRLEFKPRPKNDLFQGSLRIFAVPYSTFVSTLGASAEPGEPLHGGDPAAHSIWWRWTASSNGLVSATVDGSGAELPALSIYRGLSLTNPTLVADNSHEGTFLPTTTFQAESGQTYQFAMDEVVSSFSASFYLDRVLAPPNDDFDKRQELPLAPEFPGSTVGATSEPGEPDYSEHAGGHTVWYTWKGRAATSMAAVALGRRLRTTADNSAPFPRPFVAVYSGAPLSSLTLLDRGLGLARFQSERDAIYQIAVEGPGVGGAPFSLTMVGVTGNDDFGRATAVLSTGRIKTSVLELLSATYEPDEPRHAALGSGHSRWWNWTPSSTGRYALDTAFSPLFAERTPRLCAAVYVGGSIPELSAVASNEVGNILFDASQGTVYRIAVDLVDERLSTGLSAFGLGEIRLTRLPEISSALVSRDLLEFRIHGSAGQSVSLEASTDLVHWAPVRVVPMTSSEYRFVESRLSSVRQRFYRVGPSP